MSSYPVLKTRYLAMPECPVAAESHHYYGLLQESTACLYDTELETPAVMELSAGSSTIRSKG